METLRGTGVVVWTALACATTVVTALLAAPSAGEAQVRVGVSVDWWDWIGDVRVHGRVEYGDPAPVYRNHGYVHPPVTDGRRHPVPVRPRIREERGPPFCRSGEGHPVHGWGWCVRKGFAPAYPRYGARPRGVISRRSAPCCVWRPWDRSDVRFHSGTWYPAAGGLDEGQVVRILGRAVVEDLYATAGYRRDVPLEGRWHPSTGAARVLQVRAGTTPLAEFTDVDGDRRVDRALVARVETSVR
ncbi:MAG: hypothetical protein R3223_06630 [Longimicrobiales bacterium]|nr:hypothetical protein [Longimicrobiales bacterium]